MRKFIKNSVEQCHDCQLKARAVVKEISVVPRDRIPFAHLYMYIIGSLFDHGEYRYCLCLTLTRDSHIR